MLTRREITILLFGFTVFILSFNVSTRPLSTFSLLTRSRPHSRLSTPPLPTSSTSAKSLLLNNAALQPDGRRAKGYVDELESQIIGDWTPEVRLQHDLGPYGLRMDQQQMSWVRGDIPHSTILAHVPGFTIIDKAFVANGTIFIVSDQPTYVPNIHNMVSRSMVESGLVTIVPSITANNLFGQSVPRIPGISVLCADPPESIDHLTLLTLHRAYNALSTLSTSTSTPLPPPSLTYFLTTPRSSLPNTGYSLQLAFALYPHTTHLYADDWADLTQTHRPILFESIVLADRGAAAEGVVGRIGNVGSGDMEILPTDKRLSFAPAFALPATTGWWLHARSALLDLFSLPRDESRVEANSKLQHNSRRGLEFAAALDLKPLNSKARSLFSGKKVKKMIMYVSAQRRAVGPRLAETDHERLVNELRKIKESMGVEVFVVDMDGLVGRGWKEGVRAVLRSNIMLGVYGSPLAHCILMRPGSRHTHPHSRTEDSPDSKSSHTRPPSAIIEFFPDGKFTNEYEFVTRALGIDYIAWRNTKRFPRGSLPPISPPSYAEDEIISIEVDAVIRTVKELLKS